MKEADRLTAKDLLRYQRQVLYSGFGEEGQNRLKSSHIVIAGVGGLGSPAAIYSACAGVGHIKIIDHDSVELSNLNRQILHWDENIGEKKVFSAAAKLTRLNPGVEFTPVCESITEGNVGSIIQGADAVIDCMDNLETRFILNEACVSSGIPFIHGAVHGLDGEITTIMPGETACLACIYPELPDRGGAVPVFGVTPALIASLQIMETIKLLAGMGNLLTGRMLYVAGETMEFTTAKINRRQDCRVCGG